MRYANPDRLQNNVKCTSPMLRAPRDKSIEPTYTNLLFCASVQSDSGSAYSLLGRPSQSSGAISMHVRLQEAQRRRLATAICLLNCLPRRHMRQAHAHDALFRALLRTFSGMLPSHRLPLMKRLIRHLHQRIEQELDHPPVAGSDLCRHRHAGCQNDIITLNADRRFVERNSHREH